MEGRNSAALSLNPLCRKVNPHREGRRKEEKVSNGGCKRVKGSGAILFDSIVAQGCSNAKPALMRR
jgi:hypothetical protein